MNFDSHDRVSSTVRRDLLEFAHALIFIPCPGQFRTFCGDIHPRTVGTPPDKLPFVPGNGEKPTNETRTLFSRREKLLTGRHWVGTCTRGRLACQYQ